MNRQGLVVGIGASAGGLEALESLLENLSSSTGMSFIVIQHLSPDFGSVMDQLLARHTSMPVKPIVDATPLCPNTIYLLPPGKEVILSNGKLLITERSGGERLNFPIDEFFRSLAKDVGSLAVGVILSGTGSDGSRGIVDIHAAQGTVIAQSESSAAFNGMPRSACNTGVVDLILSPGEIARALHRLSDDSQAKRIKWDLATVDTHSQMEEHTGPVRMIVDHLRARFSLDLNEYKFPMMMRRIERRIKLCGLESVEAYAGLVTQDDVESNRLYHDMLIGVTGFFRDKEVFDRLELDVLPVLLSKLTDEDEFRCWIAGVATGEEAYTIAILLAEAMERTGREIRTRIFASDIHDASLAIAGRGIYSNERLVGVTPSRRERFFIERQDGVHVGPELRKMVVFTPHNVMRDPPFTRLDLVCCRNLLIYFNPKTQQKVLSLFHFGLKSGGVLCLGQSEALGDLRNEFQSIDESARIYRKHREVSPFTSISNVIPSKIAPIPRVNGEFSQRKLLRVYDHLLNQFSDPTVLLNSKREIQHVFGNAGKFLFVPNGRPVNDLLEVIHTDLRPTLSMVISSVVRNRQPIVGRVSECLMGEKTLQIALVGELVELEGESDHSILIRIVDETNEAIPRSADPIAIGQQGSTQEIERELQFTRESLQATIEQLQFVNEQMQAANEELTASNEELQSTNEELHSVNEELYTVNAEHQRKIDELTDLNDDIDNLLATSNVHTLFLDAEMRLRRFTPRMAEIFSLIPQDLGRSITAFSHVLLDDSLPHSIRDVINTERTVEREVQSKSGQWFLLSIFPYLSRGRVDGAVVTLVDVTSLKVTAEALRSSEERFDLAVRGSNSGIWDWQDVNNERIWCSDRMHALLHRKDENCEMTTSLWEDLIHPDDYARAQEALRRHLVDDVPYDIEYRMECGDGEFRWFHVRGTAERTAQGSVIRMAGSFEDVTDRRKAEEAVQSGLNRRDQFLAMLSHELRNPLGAISNAASLLSNIEEGSSMRANALGVLHRQLRQMTRLLDDLLDVSRITHGKIELRKEVVDIIAIGHQAALVAEPAFQTAGVNLKLDVPEQSIFVDGDPSRLEQVIVNLLNNAAKYSGANGTTRMSIRRDEGSQVTIAISDDGIGIPPSKLDDIFTLFYQSDASLDRSKGGMGLGLTLVKSIVELHGGTINAFSLGLDCGSSFTVKLPICINEPTIRPPHLLIQPREIKKIIIVEDVDDAREMLAMLLQLRGYQVEQARTGLEGLELIASVQPDVAFIDIGLPGLDGHQLAQKLRSEPLTKNVKLIALTGYGQDSDRQAVIASGFDLHLVKPLNADELDAALLDVEVETDRTAKALNPSSINNPKGSQKPFHASTLLEAIEKDTSGRLTT